MSEKLNNEKMKNDLKIIDEIENVRKENNINWMDILRLAFIHAPDEAKKLVKKINQHDNKISQLFEKLSK